MFDQPGKPTNRGPSDRSTDRPTDRPTDSLAHSLSRRQAHDSLVVRFDISARIADKGGRAGSVGRLSLNLILRFLARSVPFHHLSNRKRREDCREYISEPISGLWVRCARARYRTHTHTHTHTPPVLRTDLYLFLWSCEMFLASSFLQLQAEKGQNAARGSPILHVLFPTDSFEPQIRQEPRRRRKR